MTASTAASAVAKVITVEWCNGTVATSASTTVLMA